MQALRIVMLLVTVTVCYLWFVHSQTKAGHDVLDPATSTTAHSQYKEDMDRAQAAAKTMQDERREADAN